MPMDYRVTLDCGHTHHYRTTVHPSEREQLSCTECGQGQRATRVSPLSSDDCEFHHFTAHTAWVSSTAGGR